ncbi:Mu transposase C-terminal domain-containing protein [Pseudomonas tohonis]|nr:Mu transposase C-terminal domain-containing protein [Pseudomonas tohonis]
MAKGLLCRIENQLPHLDFLVVSQKDNSRFIANIKEIEFINLSSNGASEVVCDDTARPSTLEEIEAAQERFSVIDDWRKGLCDISYAISKLRVSRSYLFKLSKQYDAEAGYVSLLPRKRGRQPKESRLSEAVEEIIKESIDAGYHGAAASISGVWRAVEKECIKKQESVPSQTAVRARIKERSEREMHIKKYGSDSASQIFQARPGKKETHRPLEFVQMDHTLVDVILVDDERREPLGRPWLTVIIDIHTRIILGYYLSLHHPSTVSVSCAIYHAALPKHTFLNRLGIAEGKYPFYGVPTVIHMDNAKEFRSTKFQAACKRNLITPQWRPLGRKHYGGHVERLIGTFMTTKVHFLRGTTYSNTQARKGYNSEKMASMTFSEFARWFANEVCIYHGRKHAALDCSPANKWLNHFTREDGSVSYPPIVGNALNFRLDFMPEKTRAISPKGIKLHGGIYWSGALRSLVGQGKMVVKYDPFSMRMIWVRVDGEYIPIHFSDVTKSDFSLEEYNAFKMGRKGRSNIKPGCLEDMRLIPLMDENSAIIENSEKLTKRQKKANAAKNIYLNEHGLAGNEDEHFVRKEAARPDYSKRASRFKE